MLFFKLYQHNLLVRTQVKTYKKNQHLWEQWLCNLLLVLLSYYGYKDTKKKNNLYI